MHCILIQLEVDDCLVKSLLHWLALNQIVKEFNVELFGSQLQDLSRSADTDNRWNFCIMKNLSEIARVAGADDDQFDTGKGVILLVRFEHTAQTLLTEWIHD